ncbi:hypothetical protein [Cohnella sp. JJ-181]|uniref:hypothetical protein n=1 Tax=Cohnella rhizoplanae TaxID=2974897 RepID=UPI0022FF6476|nr:hypothetical protein [Cohnella sp. JJ-181]CAI6086338.1 hypothetical protein COHCIP112018_04995 [Cohnella sp. JJ-181]
MPVLPASKSSRWFVLGAASVVLTTLLLWLVRFAILGQSWTAVHAFRFFLIGLAIGAVVAVAGWLGARWLALSILIGNLLGLLLMVLFSHDRNGWEDLAGLLVYLELLAIGLSAGIVVELARLLMKRRGR